MQTNFSGLPFNLFYLLEFTQKDKTNVKSIIKELMIKELNLDPEIRTLEFVLSRFKYIGKCNNKICFYTIGYNISSSIRSFLVELQLIPTCKAYLKDIEFEENPKIVHKISLDYQNVNKQITLWDWYNNS